MVSGVEAFIHDELNRVQTITQSGNGVTDKRVDFAYDPTHRMTEMTRYSDLAGTRLVAQSDYAFDDFGRLTDLVHQSQSAVIAAYSWVHDQGNRITSFTSNDGVANYEYDDLGQIIDADYDYQADESYSYDDNGNRTKRIEIATGEVTEYLWDYRDRLIAVSVTDSDGNVIKQSEYTYDVFNKRIVKSVDADGDGSAVAEVERYVLDGEHIALTYEFCKEGIKPQKVSAAIILNIKDNQGTKYYQ
ncbi:hypothetical protein Xen7305DRAFT_00014130 [Xenococcus sp. PCC 7305]|uniref:hypothetical protein n=1 Tax=Xenococcus sp. PCC 7305 TaxID=102125 RepID=UPI0002AC01FD|nr:hypothetical protein [Xenococcus sp. PCC 7305]ELS01708.1 hypothetical protein Xen7305DRAFT_00014130 [Xenococcus sp. PCC 7305]